MDPNGSCVVAYDVGGSHISAAVCAASNYELGQVVKANLPGEETSDAFVAVLCQLAAEATEGKSNVAGASLAMPGPFDYAEGVSWMQHKMAYLYGVNLRHALAQKLGWRDGQVRFLNDAAAFLWGEMGAGSARGVAKAVGITLGTGIGSAFGVAGRVQTGGPGVPPGGEVWNLPFEGGIVEDLISTRTMKKSYAARTGVEREVADIASAAANDAAAREVFVEFGRNLGRVLRSLLHDFAPQVVVLGGGIARSAQLFLPAADQALKSMPIQLRISALGERAPLIGAGVAWFADGQEKP
ncbi:MAG TPA: ROK family protein [Terracidiphilus sp.]|nr:ROK family protein [Terracidiphilus sp.]